VRRPGRRSGEEKPKQRLPAKNHRRCQGGPRHLYRGPGGLPAGRKVLRENGMNREEELQRLRARGRALEARLSSLERRLRQMETGPAPPFRKATVNPGKCVGCGLCQAICPSGAMVVERTARVLADRCTGCGSCVGVCPEGAISLRAPRFSHQGQAARPF
jgi:ferredoxin